MKSFLTILLTVFFMNSGIIKAQQAPEIANLNLQNTDGKLVISYDLVNCDAAQNYKIWVEISGSSGKKLIASQLTGDVGSGIKCGDQKTIFWDYSKDTITIKENIQVEVKAMSEDVFVSSSKEAYSQQYTYGGLLIRSIAFPGWGNYCINRKAPYLIAGILGYGCLATSYYFNQQSIKAYDKYLEDTDASTQTNNELMDEAKRYDQYSVIAAFSAIGIWAIDITIMSVRNKQAKQKPISFSPAYNIEYQAPMLSFSYKF